MGDIGSYSANLIARYERKIRVSKKNSDEAIEEFLKNKPYFSRIGEEIEEDEATLENITNGKYTGYSFYEDGEQCDTFDNPLTTDWDWYYCENIQPLIKMNLEELRDLDLKILKDDYYFDENSDYSEDVYIGEISNYIYCSNDNSTESYIKISKKIQADLASGRCRLVLAGDGDGSNC